MVNELLVQHALIEGNAKSRLVGIITENGELFVSPLEGQAKAINEFAETADSNLTEAIREAIAFIAQKSGKQINVLIKTTLVSSIGFINADTGEYLYKAYLENGQLFGATIKTTVYKSPVSDVERTNLTNLENLLQSMRAVVNNKSVALLNEYTNLTNLTSPKELNNDSLAVFLATHIYYLIEYKGYQNLRVAFSSLTKNLISVVDTETYANLMLVDTEASKLTGYNLTQLSAKGDLVKLDSFDFPGQTYNADILLKSYVLSNIPEKKLADAFWYQSVNNLTN